MVRAVRVSFVVVSVLLGACASMPPSAPVDPAGEIVVVAEEPAKPQPPARDRFPGGPGVTLLQDDLLEALTQTRHILRYEDRLAAVRAKLGDEGKDLGDATVWYGVGSRGMTGPAECYELAIAPRAGTAATMFRTDPTHCGLPYRLDASKPFSGAGPRFTKRKLETVIAEMATQKIDDSGAYARTKLNLPDVNGVVDRPGAPSTALQWSAIGPRDEAAPITCWVLSFAKRMRLEQRELGACGIEWPPPSDAFQRMASSPPEPVKASSALAECDAKCASTDVCVTTRATYGTASSIVARGDALLAFGLDGRPVRVDVQTSCVAPPPACSMVQASCFFKPPPLPGRRDPGPCAATADELLGYSATRSTNGRFTITCTAKKKEQG